MTPTEKFVHAPLVFMEKNIVLTPLELSQEQDLESTPLLGENVRAFSYIGSAGVVFHLGLSELTHVAGNGKPVIGRRNGDVCPVYTIVKKQPGDKDSFKAYWCPYRRKNAGSVVISNKADMMFTITLNGCSLGVGHKSQGGNRLITHVNMVNMPGQDQIQAQRIMVRAQGNFGKQIIEPKDYRDKLENGRLGGNATVFGRINPITKDWIFHALKYECTSSHNERRYIHKGLVDLLEAVA